MNPNESRVKDSMHKFHICTNERQREVNGRRQRMNGTETKLRGAGRGSVDVGFSADMYVQER